MEIKSVVETLMCDHSNKSLDIKSRTFLCYCLCNTRSIESSCVTNKKSIQKNSQVVITVHWTNRLTYKLLICIETSSLSGNYSECTVLLAIKWPWPKLTTTTRLNKKTFLLLAGLLPSFAFIFVGFTIAATNWLSQAGALLQACAHSFALGINCTFLVTGTSGLGARGYRKRLG